MGKWKRQAEDRRWTYHRRLAQRLGKQALNKPAKVVSYSLQEAAGISGYSKGYLLRLLREGSIAGSQESPPMANREVVSSRLACRVRSGRLPGSTVA